MPPTNKTEKVPETKLPRIPLPKGAALTLEGENTNAQSIPTIMKYTHEIVIGLVIVLFIGFAGMFAAVGAMIIDSYQSKEATYQTLVNQIATQNSEINILIQQNAKGK